MGPKSRVLITRGNKETHIMVKVILCDENINLRKK